VRCPARREGQHLRGVERARSLGHEYEAKYGNCAQWTIAALQDSIEFVPKNGDLFLAGSCLAGGATATGNANCGGFTGAGIVIGQLCGRPRESFADRGATKLAGKLQREVAAKFEETYGSVICKEVREKAGKDCPEVVARAAGWAADAILKQFGRIST
jgi:Putative redox-active protein (C_GCAxxG_C_C)